MGLIVAVGLVSFIVGANLGVILLALVVANRSNENEDKN